MASCLARLPRLPCTVSDMLSGVFYTDENEGHPPRVRNAQQSRHFEIPLQIQDHETWKIAELTEEELLIASPVVYGFSLSDKLWRECVIAV